MACRSNAPDASRSLQTVLLIVSTTQSVELTSSACDVLLVYLFMRSKKERTHTKDRAALGSKTGNAGGDLYRSCTVRAAGRNVGIVLRCSWSMSAVGVSLYITPLAIGSRSIGNRYDPIPRGGLLFLVIGIAWHFLKLAAGNKYRLTTSLIYCSANTVLTWPFNIKTYRWNRNVSIGISRACLFGRYTIGTARRNLLFLTTGIDIPLTKPFVWDDR